jgi:protein SCO1
MFRIKKTTQLIVVLSILIASISGLAWSKHHWTQGAKLSRTEPGFHRGFGREYFPNISLTTQDGEQKRFFDDLIEGKVVLINFIFTSCKMSCPLETARLRKVYDLVKERMGEDIFFYSISVDPDNDTPDVLKSYRERFKIGKGWTFLTADEESVTLLQKKLGLFVDDVTKDKKDGHTLNLIVGNQATGEWIKRSHLENPQILATILRQLHQKQSEPLPLQSYSKAPVKLTEVSPGEKLFYSRCADCHTIGHGDSIGPDLHQVTKTRSREWLLRWIKEPNVLLAKQDPIAVELLARYNNINMPNLKLSDQDAEDVLGFIEKESVSTAK